MSTNFYIGVTDSRWFHFLAVRKPDEVNFWMPGGTGFRALPEAGLFLFKLKSPHNFVVGGGFFVRYTRLPLMLAWDAFGDKNGVESLPRLLEILRSLRPELRIEVSQRIRQEFENGKDYYRFQGRELKVRPMQLAEQPDPGYLQWHDENRYRG